MPKKRKVTEEKINKKTGKYHYSVGRRKTSVATVKLFARENSGEENFHINKKKFREYFRTYNLQNIFVSPFKATGTTGSFSADVKVRGGGFRGQAEAVRLAIARALVKHDASYKKILKNSGFLTRDSRIVERKKAGLKKARKAPQWQKR